MKGAGACIVLHTINVPKWLKVFEEFYYNVDTSSGESDTNCDWLSGPPITTIKYTTISTNFSLTITIWHNTGTINMQGPRPTLDIALWDHYPTLAAIRSRLEHSNVNDSVADEEDLALTNNNKPISDIDIPINLVVNPRDDSSDVKSNLDSPVNSVDIDTPPSYNLGEMSDTSSTL